MSSKMTCCCLMLSLVGVPRLSRAQEQSPPSIPTDLALALLESGEFGPLRQPRLVVGHAPDGMLPSVISLEGGTVLGGLTSDRNAIIVYAFTLPPNQVLLSVDRQLHARGLTPPPPPPDVNGGGFVSSGFGYGGGNAYCAQSTGITFMSMPAPRGGTYVKLIQLRNQQFNFCVPREPTRMFDRTQLKFPNLLPPPGMVSRGGGRGSGGSTSSISTWLMGPLKPVELIAHYRTQLDAAGWLTRTPATIDGEAAITYVEATDSTHVVWHGMMTALQVGPSQVDVEIKMMKPREP